MLRYSDQIKYKCNESVSMNRIPLTICSAMFVAGCATTPDCSPEGGFETGLTGAAAHSSCGEPDYLEAHRIGLALEEMRRERRELLAKEGRLATSDRARLRALERDIPELETLARMQGLIPPSALPGDLTDPES